MIFMCETDTGTKYMKLSGHSAAPSPTFISLVDNHRSLYKYKPNANVTMLYGSLNRITIHDVFETRVVLQKQKYTLALAYICVGVSKTTLNLK